jgi:hypothetical protein
VDEIRGRDNTACAMMRVLVSMNTVVLNVVEARSESIRHAASTRGCSKIATGMSPPARARSEL